MDNINKILIVVVICLGICLLWLPNGVITKHTTIIDYKGKQFILYGFRGEGYTKDHHIPVYSPVFIPLEEQKKYDKK